MIQSLINKGYNKYICNSVVSSELSPLINKCGGISISIIHEMANVIKSFKLEKKIDEITSSSKKIIFSSNATFRDYCNFLDKEKNFKYCFLKQGVYNQSIIENYINKRDIKERQRINYKIDLNTKIILGIGNDLNRKGFNYFYELSTLNRDCIFLWVSDTKITPFIGDNIMNIPMVALNKTYKLFFMADVFFLSSVEDPFPSVILEAMLSGLPVISIKGSGGADEIVNKSNGLRIDKNNLNEASDFINNLSSIKLSEFDKANHSYINQKYLLSDYINSIIKIF
ncbi:glycosyltransferase [Photobacterium damselae]|uniref:glycosyltransferase n=1 Tax=Photobacterium damselae TaxID=38293 RepID=UPI0013EDFEA1|nr:glycosyltransferase [Photobacterium damselae]